MSERWWRPEGEPRAVVLIVHGWAEHSGRYDRSAEYLTRRGYAVYAFDLRGHGRSEGERALVRSFDEYLVDVEDSLSRARAGEPGKRIFLLGHSLGGAIAALFAITRKPDVAGLVLSGPYIKLTGDVSPLRLKLALIFGTILPSLPVSKKVKSSLLSRDPEVAEQYDKDPLVYHGMMKAREAREIIRAVERIHAGMELVTSPLLILHGSNDRIADIEGSRELYLRAGSVDKTLKIYEGFYHEVLNEPGKERVLADIVAWLDAHS